LTAYDERHHQQVCLHATVFLHSMFHVERARAMQRPGAEERVMDNEPSNESPEAQATRRVQARMGFFVHASIYVVMNLGFVAIWYMTGSTYPWFVWPALGWGIGVLAHGVTLMIGPGSAAERRAIDRELRRLRELPR
jgi:hypothetical protein